MTIRDTEAPVHEEFSSVLARAQSGDADAMTAIYDRYAARVAAVVRARLPAALRRRYDTMDFAQSVFADVLRTLPRLEDRGERAFVRLLRIKAENKIRRRIRGQLGRDGRRAEQRIVTGEEPPARAPEVDAALARLDDDVKLHRLLADVDAASREALRLRSEGRSFAHIAGALGLASADAARKRHARALALLRRRWLARR